jgi:serine/threonine-protein kinase
MVRVLLVALLLFHLSSFLQLPAYIEQLQHEGDVTEVQLDSFGVVLEVDPRAANSDISVGDVVLNLKDRPGEIGTPVTLLVRTGDQSPRAVTFIRTPADLAVYTFTNWGFSLNLAIICTLSYLLIQVLIGSVVCGILLWRRSDDWMVVLVALTFLPRVPPITLLFVVYDNLLWLLWVLVLLTWPTGRFAPRWSSLLVIAAAISIFCNIMSFATRKLFWSQVENLTTVGCLGVVLVLLVFRYRRIFTQTQRQQLKWVLLGSVPALAIMLILQALTLVAQARGQLLHEGVYYIVLASLLQGLAFGLAAFGVLLAMLHYRLYDVDIFINRSLVYAALTALLVALFGLSLWLVSLLFRNFSAGPLVAVVFSAAVFGALFQPASRRMQRFVDQRFYHIEIDYQKMPAPVPFLAPVRGTEIIRQTKFGTYQALELIGRGGMAEVYKAVHPTLGLPVAIKILSAHLATDPESEFVKRFQREAQIVAKLEHPNIVRVFDYGEANGQYYIVMEYLSGQDLAHHLVESKRIPLIQTLSILTEIASALDYAHAQGLVHRDVKPANVILEKRKEITLCEQKKEMTNFSSYRAVLTDFGLVKILGGHTAITQSGAAMGTMNYIAPEQIEAEELDGRADEYALGVMTYQMLTGELPFKHQNIGALLIAHILQPPPDPRDIVPHLSPEAARAIQRALAKKPEARFPTTGEFVAALSVWDNVIM